MRPSPALALAVAFLALLVPMAAGAQGSPQDPNQPGAQGDPAVPGAGPSDGGTLPAEEAGGNPYRKGDSTFSIQLGSGLPLFFLNPSTGTAAPTNLYPGGYLSLRYMAFVSPGFALGGEAGAAFNASQAGRVLYSIPLSFEMLWYPVKMPFEFPMGVGIGGAIENLGDFYHFDPFIKPEIGAYYRVNPSWSLGGTVSYTFMPQLYAAAANDRIGNFLNIKLSAMYRL
jgi:hypothetical protein